jgi:hypothetical protein
VNSAGALEHREPPRRHAIPHVVEDLANPLHPSLKQASNSLTCHRASPNFINPLMISKITHEPSLVKWLRNNFFLLGRATPD